MATSTYTYSLRNIRLRRLADHERPLNDRLADGPSRALVSAVDALSVVLDLLVQGVPAG